MNETDHFAELSKMIGIGKGGQRDIDNYTFPFFYLQVSFIIATFAAAN